MPAAAISSKFVPNGVSIRKLRRVLNKAERVAAEEADQTASDCMDEHRT